MEYRILGRTGLKVGAIALGCEGFADKTAEEVRADFDFAIRNGINFLDLYASNPELRSNIGAALAGRREKFVIQGHLCSVWEGGSTCARAIRRNRWRRSKTCSHGWERTMWRSG